MYAVLVLNRWFGIALLLTLFIPFKKDKAHVYWNQVRLVMGVIWLAMIGWIFWYGGSTGLLVAIQP